MNLILDKREEGLKALARMISAACRRRMAEETDVSFTASNDHGECPRLAAKTTLNIEPEDLRREGDYTETIKVENFIRNRRKTNQAGNLRNCRVAKES